MASGSSGASPTGGEDQRHFYGIFVSSTSLDLAAYRKAARQAIETLRQHPLMMEDFGAHDGDATSVSTDEVAQADLVVLILAWRYGYVPGSENAPDSEMRSVTHLEYLEALRLGKPVLVFLAATDTEDRDDLFPRVLRDDEHYTQLMDFRAKLQRDRAAAYFSTPDELREKVTRAVSGWLRKRLSERSKGVVRNFGGREEQATRLIGPLLVLGIIAILVALVVTSVLVITNILPRFSPDSSSVQTPAPTSMQSPTPVPTFAYGKTYNYHGYPLGQTKQIAPNLKDDTYVKIVTLELHNDRANPAVDRSILTLSVHNADSKQSVSLPIQSLSGIYLLDSHGLRFSATDIDHQEVILLPGQDALVKVQLTLTFDDETDLFLYFNPSPAILQTHCVHLLPTNEANDKCLT